jgi:hypothetical protein
MAQMQLLPLAKRNWFWWIIKFTVWTSVLPMPLGQTAQSIKAQQPVEILH